MAQFLDAEGVGLRNGKAGTWSKFVITAREDIEGALGNVVVAFDGLSKPEMEFNYESGKVTVSYRPSLPGMYKLEITKGGKDIPGSPFKCKITPSNPVEPDKIRVHGKGLTDARPYVMNEVFIDVTEAYVLGKPKISMTGKTFGIRKYGKPDVLLAEESPGLHKVCFTPRFPGPYKLHIEFDEAKVAGSPFPVLAEDPNAPPKEIEVPKTGPKDPNRPKRLLFTKAPLPSPKPQKVVIMPVKVVQPMCVPTITIQQATIE